jgi:hypothetical protein
LGADQIVLTETAGTVSAADTVVFTSGLSIDTVTGFNVADDVAAFDLSDLETADAVIAATTLDLVGGTGVSIAAGDTVTVQTISANAQTLTAANAFVWTVGTAADAAALETAFEAAAINAGGALAVGDSFVVQYATAGNVERLALVTVTTAVVAAGDDIVAVDATDIAIVGTTANFTATNFSFIA